MRKSERPSRYWGKKYAPDDTEEGLNSAIEKEWNPLCMIELAIDHMTGKEAIELVRENRNRTDGTADRPNGLKAVPFHTHFLYPRLDSSTYSS